MSRLTKNTNWPALNAGAVLAWYDAHARVLPWRVPPEARLLGEKPDPYRVWLSEVMLQQTTVATVGRYYARFLSLWPRVADLAAAPLDAVLVEWAGLGYYARARNLHACAQAVVERHGGHFPTSHAALLSLPGIGAYTAAAVAAITADEPVAVLDGNVDRVLARFLALEVPVVNAKDELRAYLTAHVPQRAGDFAQALMDLGATICAPKKAACLVCPLADDCRGQKAEPLRFPIKLDRKPRPTRYGHAFVIRDAGGDVYLRQRGETGLLAKMTEVPGSDWADAPTPPNPPFAAKWQRRGAISHVFTHFALMLDVWEAVAPNPAVLAEGWWTSPAALGREALPTLYRKVLAEAGLPG
jgi:A/G-specific adenine glycosylase